ncbi:MAG: zf-HC2 domain-containing protein, partial [Candidatus Sulfotelmatobacter sp.]
MPELPNIVRERLKVSRPMAAHPDADVLTAFAERALPESERAVVAEHLARCHDCRDILALALPATVTADSARVLPVRGDWFGAPVLRWGVVAAGLAVLAVTGLLQYQRRHVMQTSVAARQTNAVALEETTARAGRAEESEKLAPGTPSTIAESTNAVPANPSRVIARSANGITSNIDSANARAAATAPIPEKAVPFMGSTMDQKFIGTLPLHGPARASSTPSLGGPTKQSAQLYGGAAPSSAGGAETHSQLVAANTPGQVPNQAPNQPVEYQAKDQRNGAGVSGRAFMDVTVDKAKAPQTTTVEVSAEAPVLETSSAASASYSTPSASWGISASGGLLRSFDQGRTWASVDVLASPSASAGIIVAEGALQEKYQSAPEANQVQDKAQHQVQAKTQTKSQAGSGQKVAALPVAGPVFRAVSAAGPDVWAGGSAGMLYHSADGGQRWARVVPSASGILLTGDIIGIAFSDHQHGQITTSTQE